MIMIGTRRTAENGLGLVGYAANSTHTVKGEGWSAGRFYDYMSKKGKGIVKFILPDRVLCELSK